VLVSKANRNRQDARAKIAQMRAKEARRRRRIRWLAGIGAAALVIIAAVAITLAVTSGGKGASAGSAAGSGGAAKLRLGSVAALGALNAAPAPGPAGPEGVPVPAAAPLASTATAATGKSVDGISCQSSEQTIFHIHAHLTIFVNGSPRQVPAAIGIPRPQAQATAQGPFIAGGTCFYWLHTHAADGIIHIESPVQRTYTLGDFFDEWGQQLGPDRVGPATGHVVALYDGKLYEGNPRDIPLNAHAQIQLEVGTPLVAPETVTFPNGL
jgi:hypothetical protein